MIFALAGNQNCGKTTLFNALTGSNQHVGNFPGVTVDRKEGEIKGLKGVTVVDLPGIYSLRPYTQEEIVSRDFIINEKPDGIINVVDATNIERNLYLTLQLLELKVPTVVALNMMDEVRENGGSVDVKAMSEELGVPIIPISAAKGEGVSELIDQAVTAAKKQTFAQTLGFLFGRIARPPLSARHYSPYRRPRRQIRRSAEIFGDQTYRGRRRHRRQTRPRRKRERTYRTLHSADGGRIGTGPQRRPCRHALLVYRGSYSKIGS